MFYLIVSGVLRFVVICVLVFVGGFFGVIGLLVELWLMLVSLLWWLICWWVVLGWVL